MPDSSSTTIHSSTPVSIPDSPGLPPASRIAILILLSCVIYANTLFNQFVYDDNYQVQENAYVTSWRYLPQIFTTNVWSFKGESGTTNYYRPLMTFSYLVLWQTFGELPYAFHLMNLLVHVGVVLLVYLAGRRIFADDRIGWVAALLFAVHPVHTEAVAWIASLPDLEMAFFTLLCLWLLADPAPRTRLRLVSILATFLLALLSKEPAIMLAPLALAYEFRAGQSAQTSGWFNRFGRAIPLCILAAAYLLMRIALFGSLAPVLQRAVLSWPEAIYSAFALTLDYARLLVFPAHLSAFHVFHASHAVTEPRVLAGILIVALGLAGILSLHRRAPAASFALLWAGITLAPVLNARWMAANVLAERYLYLPSVGFCWFLAWVGMTLWDGVAPRTLPGRTLRHALVSLLCLIAVSGSAKSIRQNAVWKDGLTLFSETLKGNPEAYVIQHNLGSVYFDNNDLVDAQREWEAALAGKPDNVFTMNGLGKLYTRLGRTADAEAMFKRAIAAKPLWGQPHANYGLLLQKQGDQDRALSQFQTAVRLSPLDSFARRIYGEALLQEGDLAGAEEQLEKSLALRQTPEALHSLAQLYLRQNRNDKAEVILRLAIRSDSYDSYAHFKLGELLEAAGQYNDAAKEYQAGLLTDPNNASARAAWMRVTRRMAQ